MQKWLRFKAETGLRNIASIGRWNATAHAFRAPGFLNWSQHPNITMPKADKMFGSGRYHFGESNHGQLGITETSDVLYVQAYQEEKLSRESRTNNECHEHLPHLHFFNVFC